MIVMTANVKLPEEILRKMYNSLSKEELIEVLITHVNNSQEVNKIYRDDFSKIGTNPYDRWYSPQVIY